VHKLRLFGTSGVRGKSKTGMTPKLAAKLGLTFASFLGNKGTVIVGRDVRLTAKALSDAVISGLISGGVNVEDCGVAPTPAVLWALKKKKLDGAIVVTGSHAPKDIIGFLFFANDTSELLQEDSVIFENLFFNRSSTVPWNQVGKQIRVDISNLYLQSVLDQVNVNEISSLNSTVVLDPGNGASANYCSKIFDAVNVKVFIINSDPNGLFPNRDPYPRPEVLGMLSKKVKELKADLGSATDGDGDRAIFVDNQGKIMWGDLSAGIFARNALIKSKGGVIVAPINSSRLINWVCDNNNGELVFSKIGPPAIIGCIKKEKALMGLEETGKNIWSDTILYGDWILSTLKMLEIIKEEKCSLSDIVDTFPKYYMKKAMFFCPEHLKQRVLAQALKEWRKRKEKAEVITIDGVRINYFDGSWILFRPSGTEPVFRVYVESTKASRTQELASIGSKIINNSLYKSNPG
jgi:phosphomannomutase/phosphoglucomutase